jgi:hypothetical protein
MVQQALQATVDIMPSKFTLDVDYDLIYFEDGYEKPPKEVFYTKYNELLNTHKYKVLREQRNKKLTECDWVVMSDVTMLPSVKQAWLDYRQALRDIPANTTDPENPVWPQVPE